MNWQVLTPNTEAAILVRLIQARDSLSPDVAQSLLSIDFDADDTERMNVLAERAREGAADPGAEHHRQGEGRAGAQRAELDA